VIAATVLLAYAGLLLLGAAQFLARSRWPDRAPRLGIAAWLALTWSAVASVVLGGLALLVGTVPVSADLARLLAACDMALRARYAHPGGAALAGAGAVLAAAVSGRVAWCVARALAAAVLARRRHRSGLALIGRPDTRLGAVVVDHPEPAAWCLPGQGRTVVLTSAVVRELDGAQLDAIMAHERAHQRGRHHLLVGLAGSLATAFPRVSAFRLAHEQVARLAEMAADDAAVSAVPRLAVAGALLAVGAPPVAVGALGAGGTATAARVRRLIAAPAPLSRAATAVGAFAVIGLVLVPLALLAEPAIAVSCPFLTATVHSICGPGTPVNC
jgi:Zn-dependent protease with chaperone function